ncbi:MAG TPA: acyl carrier protein [Stellaceae bacterium]|nr:acyl carrier protein [Stellaceae bacterium]
MKTEAIVTEILESVIGVKNLSRDARFLEIGGNSLNLIEVLKQIKEKTGIAPAPRMFFDKSASTIAAISAAIDAQRENSRLNVSAAD